MSGSRKRIVCGYDDDRISTLPNDVLIRILSFLGSTKWVVQTRILSTRWKYLFASVPDLSFSGDMDNSSFVWFVARVLVAVVTNLRHIRKLTLICDKSYSHLLVFTWVSSALIHNLQKLYLSTTFPENIPWPFSLSNCTALVELQLNGRFELAFDASTLVYFPHLKKVELSGLILNNEISFAVFFMECPVLESLRLSSCVVRVDRLVLLVWSLKKLQMFDMDGDYELQLIAPKLEYFYSSDSYATRGYSGSISDSLLIADISINLEDHHFEEEKVSQLLNIVSTAKIFGLSGGSMEALNYSHQQLPTFCNMTQLEISIHSNAAGWESFQSLLNSAPCLEVLSFPGGLLLDDGNIADAASYLEEWVPTCVSSNLRDVEFNYFFGDEEEFKMVEYFLKNAKVLEKIKISPCNSWDHSLSFCPIQSMKDQLPMTKRLLAFPRSSKKCQIVFTEGE